MSGKGREDNRRIHVYYAALCENTEIPLTSPLRQAEIDSISNERVRLEKYSAWRLLEYGVRAAFGIELEALHPKKSDVGRWECDKIHFSISHSGALVAVALSREPVGIDIQEVRKVRDGLAARILSESELAEYKGGENELIALWTKKEAVFKLLGQRYFDPNNIDPSGYCTAAESVTISSKDYILTVASNEEDTTRVSIEAINI
jgi:phosphopantetheinyl transferase